MSETGVSDHDRTSKKSFHRRNDSGELDVFEAARYFSGYNEAASYNCTTFNQRVMGRASLDIPMRNPLPQQAHHVVEKQIVKDKKYKQPSSPGGRLASFLNSLFNQTSSKKKKSKSTAEEESPGGRRKRRSSISHFSSSRTTTTTTTTETKSFYSSSSSGFRTPPPYAYTPTKSCKEFRSYSDHKHIGPTKQPAIENAATIDDKRWLDENLGKRGNVGVRYPPEEKGVKKFNESDDGADSDSSSDLFELQNYDLGVYSNYSSGLPVYETTHIDTIKRGAPISNGAI